MSYKGQHFFQNIQKLMQISEKHEKNLEKIVFSHVIAFELVALNSHYYEESTHHRKAMY